MTQVDKYKIQGALAKIPGAGPGTSPSGVKTTVERLFPTYKPKQIEKAVTSGSRLMTIPSFRKSEMMASELFARDPVSVMEKLHPQETYEIENLVRFVKGDPSYKNNRLQILDRPAIQDIVVIALVADKLRDLQRVMYRAPTRTRKLHGTQDDPGVLREISNEISKELHLAGQAPADKSIVPRAVNRAACRLFGLSHADEGGAMDLATYYRNSRPISERHRAHGARSHDQ